MLRGVVFVPPLGSAMTMAGGFPFGALARTTCVVADATVGATLLFLVAKLSLGDFLCEHADPGIRKMAAGFQENELNYMLVPLFPFRLVNLAPAFLGVRLRTFVIGTFRGIVSGTAVFPFSAPDRGAFSTPTRKYPSKGL